MIDDIYIRALGFSCVHNEDFTKKTHKLRVRYSIGGVPGEEKFQELCLYCVEPPPADVDWLHDTDTLKGKLLLCAIKLISSTIKDLRPEQTDFVPSIKEMPIEVEP